MGKRFEDMNLGDKFLTPGRTITDAAISTIMGYAGYCAPFMIDEEYAKGTIFGGRIAPGRLTLLMMGGLVEMSGLLDMEGTIALVGMNNIRIRSPLRAGDTIRVEIEVIQKRVTSNPEQGIIVHKEVCKNQREQIVAEAEVSHMMKVRV